MIHSGAAIKDFGISKDNRDSVRRLLLLLPAAAAAAASPRVLCVCVDAVITLRRDAGTRIYRDRNKACQMRSCILCIIRTAMHAIPTMRMRGRWKNQSTHTRTHAHKEVTHLHPTNME